MPNQADVNVENQLADDITVVRQLENGTNDVNESVVNDSVTSVNLPSTDVLLVITPQEGVNLSECPLKVKSDVDL